MAPHLFNHAYVQTIHNNSRDIWRGVPLRNVPESEGHPNPGLRGVHGGTWAVPAVPLASAPMCTPWPGSPVSFLAEGFPSVSWLSALPALFS